jgi:CubicO group peptidase (beta-lactamase class C family)
MRTRFPLAALAALLLTAVQTFAAEPAAPQGSSQTLTQALLLVDQWLDAQVAFGRMPGAAAGIVVDQDLVWSRGYGWADIERKAAATSDTLYGICSISKLFTAVAVMLERDAGRLRLDDPVTDHLAYFRLEESSPGSPPVTIRDLLTHSGGIPRESPHPYWTGPEFAFPSREEIVAGLARQRMLYPAERYFQYSNLGMSLLGQVVEETSGLPYETYVQERILGPLGLAATAPFLPEAERGRRLATGYGTLTRDGVREVMPFYRTRGVAPAAGFASNVRDLAAFAAWQFRLLGRGGTEVLAAATLREMQRPQWVDPDWKTTRGLGFWIGRDGATTLVGHTGSCPGYRTALRLDPRRKVAAIVLVNAMGVSPEAMAERALQVLRPALESKATTGSPDAVPTTDLEKFAGRYTSAWGETVVVPWQDGLAALEVPTDDPAGDLAKLRHVGGTTFRRIRDDGDDLGEEVVFEVDADGRVTRFLWHQNYSVRAR